MKAQWATAPRPSRWAVCEAWMLRWTKVPPWNSNRIHTPHHYMSKCPVNRTDYSRHMSLGLEPAQMDAKVGAIAKALAGRVIFFLGDSLSLEHWLAAVCWFGTVGRLGEVERPDMRFVHLSRVKDRSGWAQCVTTASRMQLCYSHCSEAALIDAVNGTWPPMRTAIIVANYGILGFDTPRDLLRQITRAYLDALASIPAHWRPTFVWRETSPQHFNTTKGDGTWSPKHWQRRHMGRLCAPIEPARLSNVSNEASLPLVRAAGVEILGGVWTSSASRWGDHLGWTSMSDDDVPLRPGQKTEYHLDCTHYCLASGVLDHWVELLVVWLLRQLMDDNLQPGITAEPTAEARPRRWMVSHSRG